MKEEWRKEGRFEGRKREMEVERDNRGGRKEERKRK